MIKKKSHFFLHDTGRKENDLKIFAYSIAVKTLIERTVVFFCVLLCFILFSFDWEI